MTRDGPRTVHEFEEIPLYYYEEGIMHVFAGLEDDLTRALKHCKFKVKVKRVKPPILEPVLENLTEEDLDNLDDRADQVEVIGLVCDQPRSFIVEAPTGWGKSFAIVQIAKILPDSNIAIIAPGIEICQTLYDRLRKQINPRQLGMVSGGASTIGRITVCTMQSMQKLRHVEWDLMLFDEVHRAGGRKTANDVAEVFNRCKCVGFSASPEGRGDNADKVVKALFGPIIYRVEYEDAKNRGAVVPIEVDMYRITTGREYSSKYKEKYGLWNNQVRNEFIAKLISEIPEDEQVLITVATAEHALALKALLPEFEVVFKSATSKNAKKMLGDFPDVYKWCRKGKMLKEHVEYLRRQFEQNKVKRAIATQVWSTGVDFVHLRYLIRAEGTASKIQATQVPGRLSRTSEGKTQGKMIDFIDEFDSTLMGRSQSRKRLYQKKKWNVNVLSHPDVTIPRFKEQQ